ncbi:hypothetical protein CP083_01930 [Candidatus Bathyarchaeota archaeon B24-2]|nr:MAG: hypothetical protein CP083_01930 [Candidatus Bathyarchaeota archaeon B24-2]
MKPINRLFEKADLPLELYKVKVTEANDEELIEISKELNLELNLNEMKAIQRYFRRLRRDPTDVELQTIGQTWSEHCFHKTFKGTIVAENKTVKSIFRTYIARVTEELNPEWCISVFKDNAGIIEFEEEFAIAVKVETHNHPSAVEPFGGAATGIGGVIRDILGVWAEPIANTDVLCFGPLDTPYDRIPRGIKHPRYLFNGVVAGIASYGNNMGLPTVNGAIYFDEGYIGNVVVYCGCIGILRKEDYIKNTKPGDIVLLVGGETGRDGIHGVTFASAELTEASEETGRAAVQIPNPFEEEKLRRAILRVRDEKLGSGITDLGGGGLSSAVGETAYRSGCGVEIDLDKVPLRDPTLAPWEIWISESQERMLLTIPEDKLERTLEIFEEEEVKATPIGVFTEDKRLKLKFRGHKVAEMDLEFLFSPPERILKAEWKPKRLSEPTFDEPEDLTNELLNLLSSPNISSREPVIRVYDHEVRGATVLKPLNGMSGGPNDAAVLKPLKDSWRGVVISSALNPNYGKIDPYWMAASSIDEAIRNNTCVGGRRIALLDNFTWGNPERPERLGELLRAAEACYDIAKVYGTPFISGKDSLYNESPMGPVTSTLLITAVGVIPDIRKSVSSDLKAVGNPLYVVGETLNELGGSEYYRLKGFLGANVPKVNPKLGRKLVNRIVQAIDLGYVRACHDASEGGLAVALSEMAIGGNLGVEIWLSNVPRRGISRNDLILFSESNSRFIVEVKRKFREEFEKLFDGLPYGEVGLVTRGKTLTIYGLDGKVVVEAEVDALSERWRKGLGD